MKLMIDVFKCLAALAGMSVLGGAMAIAQTVNVDVSNSQQPFARAVFGQNEHANPYYSEGYGAAYDKNLELLNGTSNRGVAGGIRADSYDWRIREFAQGVYYIPGGGEARGISTLDYLREARDRNTLPIITVNQRGLGSDVDGNGEVIYTDTSTATLTLLASDWVRYTNHILQTYRQGDVITDSEDLRILNSMNWAGGDYTSDKLLAPGEAAVPKVNYWEIGNEVNFFGTASAYRTRYHAITTAMVAQDSSIKVGPNVTGGYQNASVEAKNFLKDVLRPSAINNPTWERVDFVSYHPYGYQILGVADTDHAGISQQLKAIKGNQLAEKNWVKTQINQTFNLFQQHPNRDNMELLATEWNPSTYNNAYRLRQWNALGIVETAMTMAEEGLAAANYWVWPAYILNGAELPQYKAFEALTQYGGDTLVSSYSFDETRLYITQDSKTGAIAVWGMNFLFGDPGDAARTLSLSLNNLGIVPGQIELKRLAKLNGSTTLIDSVNPYNPNNLSIGWITTDMTGMNLQNFDFTINPAELQLLVIRPLYMPGDFNQDGAVDAADYVVWRKNPGGVYTPADFELWQANFGRIAGSSAFAGAAVPEPSSVMLLQFVGLLCGVLRNSRRSRTRHERQAISFSRAGERGDATRAGTRAR